MRALSGSSGRWLANTPAASYASDGGSGFHAGRRAGRPSLSTKIMMPAFKASACAAPFAMDLATYSAGNVARPVSSKRDSHRSKCSSSSGRRHVEREWRRIVAVRREQSLRPEIRDDRQMPLPILDRAVEDRPEQGILARFGVNSATPVLIASSTAAGLCIRHGSNPPASCITLYYAVSGCKR